MKIYVLFAQRHCEYPGQYEIEALETIGEAALEDGGDEWMKEKIREYEQSGEFDALKLVPLEVSRGSIQQALYPLHEVVTAEVINE